MDWEALRLSFALSTLTALLLLPIGLPLAWVLTFTRFPGRALLEAVVALPLVLPPTVLGFYVLLATGPQSPFGRAYEQVTGDLLPFSFTGLLLASLLYSLPFAVQPFAAAFAAVDTELLEAAACLGASRLRILRTVVLPLARPGIVAGTVLAFAHTLGEFGVVLMVGGNIPGRTRTLSIAIYDHVQALEYAAAGRTALLLLVISFVVLAATSRLQRRAGGAAWGWPR